MRLPCRVPSLPGRASSASCEGHSSGPAVFRASGSMADKHNALEFIGNLWYRTFLEVAADFPEVQASHIFVDALCHDLVRDPARFEVIVTSNLFGDLISDLGAALVGGLGVAPSANVNPESRRGLFEPVHGSAPDIAERARPTRWQPVSQRP